MTPAVESLAASIRASADASGEPWGTVTKRLADEHYGNLDALVAIVGAQLMLMAEDCCRTLAALQPYLPKSIDPATIVH
jgi:hypothetical protein